LSAEWYSWSHLGPFDSSHPNRIRKNVYPTICVARQTGSFLSMFHSGLSLLRQLQQHQYWLSPRGGEWYAPPLHRRTYSGNMRFCCSQFEGWSQEAGKRGFAIYCYRDEDKSLRFAFQHRALDPDGVVPHTDCPLSLISDMHLLCCPWCGVLLDTFYRDSPIPARPTCALDRIETPSQSSVRRNQYIGANSCTCF
jgi:hypothetical protein